MLKNQFIYTSIKKFYNIKIYIEIQIFNNKKPKKIIYANLLLLVENLIIASLLD